MTGRVCYKRFGVARLSTLNARIDGQLSRLDPAARSVRLEMRGGRKARISLLERRSAYNSTTTRHVVSFIDVCPVSILT